MAGIRVYFGNHDKTLIRRQREDDPVARLPAALCPSLTEGVDVNPATNAFTFTPTNISGSYGGGIQ